MGISMSTLLNWGFVVAIIGGWYRYSVNREKARNAVRPAPQRQRVEERQPKKETKEKAKRQRPEQQNKEPEPAVAKTTQAKDRAQKPSASNKPSKQPVADDSSDDGIDNREFARQLASIKQGTNLNAPKKDEKRQKSVKQSRAQIIDDAVNEPKASKPSAPALVSAPSSTAGVDADDDESSNASPELKAADAGGVSDMLEPKSSGPSVLRLTDTDKAKPQKEKKAKEPEKTETKKQRQNRKKREQEQEQRREDEKQRKAAEEAQRRQARIAEGRAAKDGSAFMAAQAQQPSAWTGNGANGSGNASTTTTNGDSAPAAALLDTFDTDSYVNVSLPKAKSAPKGKDATSATWISSLPSEEEQMEMLRDEEAWNTVKTKKSKKKATANAATESANESEPSAAASKPTLKQQPSNGSGVVSAKPANTYARQSSFAALTSNDEPEVEAENEWDV
ncbi:hypothetical protein QBC42DRAFT_35554 [Cladorrhinum samala]|uniref:Uncharacterized protein n=1 Tax=Cladorrhinum samala TaxID=585594 RepID=A0AAV9HDT3_9PEZI|nr:hypothetical protein QBC42DRAFT_35554 [Cladorrhinum samala]